MIMDNSKEEIDKIVKEKKSESPTEEVIENRVDELQNEEEKKRESQSNEQIDEESGIKKVEPKSTEIVKKNKLSEAKELIKNSKELVSKVETEVEECKVGVSKAAEEFDKAKRNFNNTTFKNSKMLLEKLGFDYSSYDEAEPFELSLDKDDSENFSVKDISSGKFTGFILALLVALATVGGLVYLALSKLNIKIDPKTITPETAMEHVDPVLNWIGTLGGHTGGNSMIGAIILGFSALLVAWLVYAVRVYFKENKNLQIAKQTLEKSKDYYLTKKEHKKEMQKIDSHLREATAEVGNFEAILNEKVGTLKRILHIEGEFDEDKEYHPSSKKIMRETEKIMQGIENLLNTAITKEGKLNSKSVQALSNAKAVYADYLARIYD